MAQLLAAGGTAIGQGISAMGTGMQAVAGGDFGPLIGTGPADLMKSATSGLMDAINPDLTKDPYKPNQPVVYDDKGALKQNTGGLLGAMAGMEPETPSVPKQQQQQTLLSSPQITMTTNPPTNAAGVPLHRQAYGK